MDEIIATESLKAVAGTTYTVAYECSFDDATKKTVTVGSFKPADLPNSSTIKAQVNTFNTDPDTQATGFSTNFVSSAGANFNKINAVTITAKTIDILIG